MKKNKVTNYCNKRGEKYFLLDNEYINSNTKMNWQDSYGYKYYTCLNKIRDGSPLKFSCSNPYTIFNIKLFLKINNLKYQYIEGEYENSKSKLEWIDNEGYKYQCTFESLKQDVRPISGHNSYSIDNIKKYIQLHNRKDTLISTEYINNTSKLNFICEHGHSFMISWSDYQQGKGCRKCVRRYENKEEFLEVIEEMYGDEYSILSDYINSQTKIKVRHNKCGNIFLTTPNSLTQGHGCPNRFCCHVRGENHYKWNPLLSDEDRKNNESRLTMFGYKEWRNKVFQKDNYTCVICGAKRELIGHHLNSWNNCVEKRFDPDNGVTLCQSCHIDFHNKYGYGNNTEEQFNMYVKYHDNTEVIC